DLGRGLLVRERRVRLAEAVLGGVRRRAVVAHLGLDAPRGINHGNRDLLAVLAARIERGVRGLQRRVGGDGGLVCDEGGGGNQGNGEQGVGGGVVFQGDPKEIIPTTPAAPIPPPMHIVTTTCFTPRRRPSISAWPTRREPETP